MQKYFIDDQLTYDQQFQINETDHHHIRNVMRNHDGDHIICIDTKHQPYLCCIENVNQGTVKVIEALDIDNELDVEVTLIYALPKGDKFELVLQKACELGVTRIIPLQSRRCVVKMTAEKMAKKLPRYQKILKEASEQSGRNRIPDIENVITVKDISSYLGDINLVAYEETAKQKGYDVETVTTSMLFSGRYMAENEGGDGICKVVVDKKYHRVLGVHMIGNYASEIIYGAAMMIETEMRVEDLREIVFPHPTVCEIIREALFEIK